MSTNLDNTFDEILTKGGNVFFVDKLWIKSLSDNNWVETLDLHDRLKLISDVKEENFFRIDINDLTCEQFIKHLIGEQGLSKAIDDAPEYSVFMDAFSQMKPGVVVFYRTHLISSDMLRFFSKLIRYTKKHNLEWKFVFYGKAKELTHNIKERLFIEHFYPEQFKKASQVNELLVDDASTPKRFRFVTGLIVVCALIFVGAGTYIFGNKSSSHKDNQVSINGAASDEIKEPSHFQSSFESTQTLNEMIKESKLKALAFEEAMAEIQKAQALEADFKQSNTKEIAQTVSSSNKSSRLLSGDIENAISSNDLAFLQSFDDKQMLSYGRNSEGETPLIISANNGHDQIVQWLLQQNAVVDTRDSYGRTALFYSAVKGNENLVKLLLQAGARVSIGSNLSKTPLMAAVHNNHLESARLLLATGKVEINAQDHSGWSALFYAVWNSNSQMSDLLLESGASTKLVDTSGLNIDQIASAAGFKEWK